MWVENFRSRDVQPSEERVDKVNMAILKKGNYTPTDIFMKNKPLFEIKEWNFIKTYILIGFTQ